MIKHIIAGIATALAIWACVHLVSLDKEVHKLDKITALIKSTAMEDTKLGGAKVEKSKAVVIQKTTNTSSSQNKKAEEKLAALKRKAGNIAAFEVSPLYKKRCSSCHGNIGQGIIGPKLMGRDKEYVLSALHEFKSGKRRNYVMYGLLGSMTDEQLEFLADEISTFQKKYDESQK